MHLAMHRDGRSSHTGERRTAVPMIAVPVIAVIAVIAMPSMITMPMVVAVDGGAGNLIADEQDHRLEQVDKRSLRSLTSP